MDHDPRIYFDPDLDDAKVYSGKGASGPLKFLGKVAMMIPGEVVVGYQFIMGLIPTVPNADARPWLYLGSFILFAILTAVYMGNRMTGFERRKHLWLFVLAYIVWAYGLSGDKLVPIGWWTHESARGIVLAVGSLLLGIPKLPKKRKS